jgi:hypothetical protein
LKPNLPAAWLVARSADAPPKHGSGRGCPQSPGDGVRFGFLTKKALSNQVQARRPVDKQIAVLEAKKDSSIPREQFLDVEALVSTNTALTVSISSLPSCEL